MAPARLYVFVIICLRLSTVFVLPTNNKIVTTTSGALSPEILHQPGDGNFEFYHLVPAFVSSNRVERDLCPHGFHHTKTAITKWLKHGSICLVAPGHDPPLDLTISMDISINPGQKLAFLILHLIGFGSICRVGLSEYK